MNQPRKHHFVSKFYLAGFTRSGQAVGELHVLDQSRLKTWTSTPEETAHQRDYHAVDLGSDHDPMIFEKKLGDLEGRWSEVLRQIGETRALPKGDLFGDLMMFVAFMAVRVPRIRETIDKFIEEVRQKEAFARNWLRETGRAVDVDEQADDGMFPEFNQTQHVQEMIRLAALLGPLLAMRHWNLWIAADDSPDLICSDSPVAPRWFIPVSGPWSPAFGTRNTIVTVPLNRRMAIVSMLEFDLGPRTLDQEGIAQINSATGMYANQLYSSGPDFFWLTSKYRVAAKEELLAALRLQSVA